MRGLSLGLLLVLASATSSTASDIVYITDLPSYVSLAPCAEEAVSYVVGALTNGDCQPGVTALESCACTKDQNSAAASSSISSLVLEYCSNTATDDVVSASLVFSNYCNQGAAAATTTQPTGVSISLYITDLPAFALLGPCAGSALGYAVQALTNNACPASQEALQSCACTKNQNSLSISENANSLVLEYCGSTHSDDVTSAQAVFAGYCGLGAGTSSFPSTSALAGDVTYYITDLPQFSSLAPCAGNAVSYGVLAQINKDCQADPKALVSCACVKDQNSMGLSSSIASLVGEYCSSTASDDITSALEVFAYYCSAGRGLVTPQGVTASVTVTGGGSGSGSGGGSGGGGGGGSSMANPTTNNNGIPSQTSGSGSTVSIGGTRFPVAAVVGGIAGGVVLIICILSAIWRHRRRHRYRQTPPPPPPFFGPGPPPFSPPPPNNYNHNFGKQELASTPIPPPIVRKPAPAVKVEEDLVSPIEQTGVNELQTPPAPNRAEAPGTTNAAEMNGVRDPAEVQNLERQHGGEMVNGNPGAIEMSATSGPFELHGHQEWRN